ncbi:TetR/AcrR family transcriptional regulator [Stutzerimonas stutzeri]|uniref:TetR/AcrR family transcriptional regulator n=1 Tax=Stutzerimonas stutzeri TaxID=316 RepID=UPI000F794872|nr:TetR/AcrR family transcriptional regulator [Stutzerimonas stutzeri]RRV82339.1 TetR/AcrR family transcriptional regulator [Stutzerimonas stutzeri]RRW28824.1 TetR/AcrR family transcriptional regulator [Stutzerimonas stutzeri]
MAPRAKTRDRIIEASLALFNAQGERNVTTNHIAAHLGISPGNLYYHFPNKQAIVAELFGQYEARVDAFLRLPLARAMQVEDKAIYLEALLGAMWDYRFLHRDLEGLLDADVELARRYEGFAARCLQQAQAIYQGFVDAGILLMDTAQVEDIALNAWIIITSWVRFLSTSGIRSDRLSEALLRRGVYQVLVLEECVVADAARAAYGELCRRFRVALDVTVREAWHLDIEPS